MTDNTKKQDKGLKRNTIDKYYTKKALLNSVLNWFGNIS